ncbi:MAG TPA: protein kinase [Armatimonadota bacterium]|jgi:serine/threonine-protein kinase
MPDASAGTVGAVLNGRYEILERLGDGAVFHVLKAQDLSQNRTVAIKMLQPQIPTSPQSLARLEREAQRAATLNHPSIAKVYEYGVADGVPYVVMEYIRGIHLKERIRRVAPFPLAVAVDIALALAEALDAAHRQGVVHGDLRSHNVLISSDGRVKLTDFALESALSGAGVADLKQRSVHYVSPEVAEGQAPGPSSDLYSLGIILYEMLTGSVPFEGDTPIAVAVRHAREAPTPPSRINAGIPRALEGIVLKCLQKDPARRYRSAAVLIGDLRAVQEALRFGRPLQWSPLEEAEEEEEVETRQSSSFLPVAIGVAGLVALGSLIALVILMSNLLKGTKDLRVPDVLGKDQTVAERVLKDAGLDTFVHPRPQDDVPEGQVFKQLPEGGTSIKPGRQVALWVSEGPKPVTVPDLVTSNLTLDEARSRLSAAGLALGPVTQEYSEEIRRGRVLSQDPSPGATVPRKQEVSVKVSQGPMPEPSDLGTNPPDGGTPPDSGGEPASPGPAFKLRVDVMVPKGPDPQEIQIEVTDDNGRNVVMDEPHSPGDSFTRTIPVQGKEVLLRVLSDGKIIFEQTRLPGNRFLRRDGTIGRVGGP